MLFYLVSIRLKSVKNIQKITKSMKMVSAAKYAKAERELKPARAYGEGAYGRLNNGKRREILIFPTPTSVHRYTYKYQTIAIS